MIMEMTLEKRNAFINDNMGIIGNIVDTVSKGGTMSYVGLADGKGYSRTDLINSGVIGMIKGICKFDPSYEVPLEAFVRIDIRREVSEFIAKPRKHDRSEFKVSMQAKVSNQGGDSITIEEMVASRTTEVSHGIGVDKEALRDVLKLDILSDVEHLVLKLRFEDGLKFREMDVEVKKFLNNPKSKAFYFLNTALGKLNKALA
jgi:DNA-directed RNA polymerase specialized sigma subunit